MDRDLIYQTVALITRALLVTESGYISSAEMVLKREFLLLFVMIMSKTGKLYSLGTSHDEHKQAAAI